MVLVKGCTDRELETGFEGGNSWGAEREGLRTKLRVGKIAKGRNCSE